MSRTTSLIPRSPRHRSDSSSPIHLQISGDVDSSYTTQLVDISRQGIQVASAEPLDEGSKVSIGINLQEGEWQVRQTGVVRWCRRDEDGKWRVGCLFDQKLSWELLGELILCGAVRGH